MNNFHIEPIHHTEFKLVRNSTYSYKHVILDFQNVHDSSFEFIRLELYPKDIQGCAIEIRYGIHGCTRFLPEYDFLDNYSTQYKLCQYILEECNENSTWVYDEDSKIQEFGFTGYKRKVNNMPKFDETMIPVFIDAISKYNTFIDENKVSDATQLEDNLIGKRTFTNQKNWLTLVLPTTLHKNISKRRKLY